MCSENPTWAFKLFGVCDKYEVLKFLGIGMGGILFVLQVLASHRRAKAMEETATAQAKATKEQAKANLHTEQGQRQERLKKTPLSTWGTNWTPCAWVGAYELFHLAEDTPELCQTVLDILCAHIRSTTGEDEYRKNAQGETLGGNPEPADSAFRARPYSLQRSSALTCREVG